MPEADNGKKILKERKELNGLWEVCVLLPFSTDVVETAAETCIYLHYIKLFSFWLFSC